jgi:hypothetical protein
MADRVPFLPDWSRSYVLFLSLADDNVFIPFQPGNGKVKIKEPKQQVKIAKQKLDEVLSS